MNPLPPRLFSIILTLFVTFWMLEDFSRQVSSQFSTICVAPLIWLVLLVDYVYCFVTDVEPEMEEKDDARRPRGLWRWFVLPIALVTVFSALSHPWPMTLRFFLSRKSFEQKVAEVYKTEEGQNGQWVGLYWVPRITPGMKGQVQFVTGYGLSDPVGFVYDPSRPPPRFLDRHIVGNWYATEW